MTDAKRRPASGTDQNPLIVDWRYEQSRQGPYAFLKPVPLLSRQPETDEEYSALVRWFAEKTLRSSDPLLRALKAVHPAVPAEDKLAAARISRERFFQRLQELLDDDEERAQNPTGLLEGGTSVVLPPISKLAIDPLRRLLLAAAGCRADPDRRTGKIDVYEMEWPAFDDLPPEIWFVLDLIVYMFFTGGKLEQAELQSREIVAGVKTKEGGRKRVRQRRDLNERFAREVAAHLRKGLLLKAALPAAAAAFPELANLGADALKKRYRRGRRAIEQTRRIWGR